MAQSTIARNASYGRFGRWSLSHLNDWNGSVFGSIIIVGTSAGSEYATLPLDNKPDGSLNRVNGQVEKYKTAAGFDMWTIFESHSSLAYYTVIAPKVEELNFNGLYANNNGGNPGANIALVNSYGDGAIVGLKAGPSDDILITDPSLYIFSDNRASSKLFVIEAGAGIDTLFIPYTQDSRIALERNSLGLSRVRFSDAALEENHYITTGIESISFVDKAWATSAISNYNVVNSYTKTYRDRDKVVQLSTTYRTNSSVEEKYDSFNGSYTVPTGLGTSSNDLMIAAGAYFDVNKYYWEWYDGGPGFDILGLFNFNRSKLTDIRKISSSAQSWRLTFGTTVLEVRNIEAVQLFDSAVRLNTNGTTTNIQWIPDTASLNSIVGTSLNDSLYGTADGDSIFALASNDVMVGYAGNDKLDGGLGTDTASYFDKTTAVIATLNSSTATNVSVGGIAEDTIINVENLTGGAASDRLIGDSLANALSGNDGNDYLSGRNGVDRLIGGLGADIFRFDTLAATTTSQRDLIIDFSSVQGDKLSFNKAVYLGFGAATKITKAQFRSGAGVNTASNPSQRFLYDTKTGILRFDRDGAGKAFSPLQVAQLGSGTSHPLLGSTDFQLS